jgi:endonuclease/exonuclease/phosphatase family metal-dependent hydrolase
LRSSEGAALAEDVFQSQHLYPLCDGGNAFHFVSNNKEKTMSTRKLHLASLLSFVFAVIPAFASDATVKVMTRNLYLGTDLTPVLAAQTTEQFLMAVSAAFAEVQATNFPERAERLADEIDRNKPLLVGLQEVAIWRSQFPADFSPTPNATTVEYDFLELLHAALEERGLHYSVVIVATRADVEAPGLTAIGLKDYRLTMRDAILVQDSPADKVHLSNIIEHLYAQNLVIGTFVGPIVFTRGWEAVDVTIDRTTFRFVNTHLESFAEVIRSAQAAELIAGPINTELPVIITGDFNAAPGTPTYALLANAGFRDAAAEEDGGNAGATCCQAANLRNAVSELQSRIDLVLFRGNVDSKDVDRVGYRETDRTVSGLWPSDHAGVVARLKLGGSENDD